MLRSVLHIALFGNYFIALCAGSLTAATFVLLGIPVSWRLCWFAAAATLAVYSGHALFMSRAPVANESERQLWIKEHMPLLVISLVVALLAAFIFILPFVSWQIMLFLAHLAFIAMGYTIPVIPVKNGLLPLRSVPLLKVLLIAYVWAAVTVGIPALQSTSAWSSAVAKWLFAERFLFILSLALLFDIRDVSRDRLAHVLTLPVLLGNAWARAFSLLLLMLFCCCVVLRLPLNVVWPLLVSAAAGAVVVLLADENRSDRFYSGYADGIMMLQAILVVAAAVIF